MECNQWQELISEYVDKDLSAEVSRSVEGHLRDCAACRRQEMEIRTLLNQCRVLEDQTAGEHHWNAIRRQMIAEGMQSKLSGEKDLENPSLLDRLQQQLSFYKRLALASVAACLMILAGNIGALMMFRPSVTPADGASMRQWEVRTAVFQLEKAITRLSHIVDKTKPAWQPTVRQVVETNLAVLDQAIADTRMVLSKEPDNEEAGFYLIQACQRKLAVLDSVLEMNGI